MLQAGRHADLLHEALRARTRSEPGVNHLDRDPTVVFCVAGQIHRGHAASSERSLDVVHGPVLAARTAGDLCQCRGLEQRLGEGQRPGFEGPLEQRRHPRRVFAPCFGASLFRSEFRIQSLLIRRAHCEAVLRLHPVAAHCPRRHAERRGRFLLAQAAEEPALHDARQTLVDGGEGGERVVERYQELRALAHLGELDLVRRIEAIDRHPFVAPPALFRTMLPGVVDEDSAHHPCGDREEVRTVHPLHVPLVHKSQIRLVHERGGIQGVAVALFVELAPRDGVQFVVHERDEVVPCVHVGAATLAKGRELPADVVFGVVAHRQRPPAECLRCGVSVFRGVGRVSECRERDEVVPCVHVGAATWRTAASCRLMSCLASSRIVSALQPKCLRCGMSAFRGVGRVSERGPVRECSTTPRQVRA